MSITLLPPKNRLLSGAFDQPPRYTRAACEMMEREGFLPERWELIDGEVIIKVGQKNRHALAVTLIFIYLVRAFGPEWIRNRATMDVGESDAETNLPEPDALVLKQPTTDDRYLTYDDVQMVAEIADTTISRDSGGKARLYARCAIAEYWIVDVIKRTVTVYRQPNGETGEWAFRQEYAEGDSVAPAAAPQAAVTVRELLP